MLGLNPYKKRIDFLKEKCQLGSQFDGNIATRWGNMFEDVTRKFTEFVLQMKEPIIELGSLEGAVKGQRYSPDGLGLAYLVDEEGCKQWYIVLFEFKSPLRSLPNLKIPKHYLPQVLTGLLSVPIADLSIFTNISYRKCNLKQLNFEYTINDVVQYDTRFHTEKSKTTKAEKISLVYAVGMIVFYQSEENYRNTAKSLGYDDINNDDEDDFDLLNDNFDLLTDHDTQLCYDSAQKPYDLGDANARWMDSLMQLVEAKRIKYVTSNLIYNIKAIKTLPIVAQNEFIYQPEEKAPSKSLIKWCNQISVKIQGEVDGKFKNRIVGYMPFKIMKADMILQHKVPEYIDVIKPEIEKFLTELEQYNSLPIDQRQELFYKNYMPFMFDIIEDMPEMPKYEEPICE